MTATRYVRPGFTLIELLIVIAIIAILAAVGVPLMMNRIDQARISGTKSNLRSLKASIDMFRIDTGKYPTKLRDLVEKPREEALAKKWQKGGYLEGGELPKDPWSEDFQYKVTAGGKNPYELYSYGPQGPGAPNNEWYSVWDINN
jgi:general secretion pathway protein G